jgi:hypothetical protein
MEGLLWNILRKLLAAVHDGCPRGIYSERDILMVWLWAILFDRPLCWACQAEHWPAQFRPRRLPHPSTLSRRLKSAATSQEIQRLHQATVAHFKIEKMAIIDGKPLIVSDVSQDPEATNGRGTRGMARGYKMHCVISPSGVVEAFEVQPLNVNERVPARRLLGQLPAGVRRALADGNYDSGPLHSSLKPHRVKLYTPIINNYAGPRSHPRRRVLQRLMNHPLGQKLRHFRDHIERCLARMGNIGFGLKGLPNWVRRLTRVTNWISGKILLYHAYLLLKLTAS